MCGIAGFVVPEGQAPLSADRVPTFLRELTHRGPDDLGFAEWRSGKLVRGRKWASERDVAGTVLLHRRLSILDLAESGWQPMFSPDGSLALVFNGEIYNYLEIKERLEKLGHRFVSTSDTEVLLHSYMEWGTAAFQQFVGMFAFAILDTKERQMLLARDFFGIKPLYYVSGKQCFSFASEIKPLLGLPFVSRAADPQQLFEYLRFGETDHEPKTMFADVRQIPPGHFLTLSLDRPSESTLVSYWKMKADPIEISFSEAAAKVRELFFESVSLHLRSDVPVGTLLSGGIDSSAIVCAVRQILGPDKEFSAFSFIPEDEAISEERWIRSVVERARPRFHRITPTPTDVSRDFQDLVRIQEEPFGSTSVYAQLRIFRAIQAQGMKVVLDGQGADELFAGYRTFVGARLASLLRGGRLLSAARLLSASGKLPGFGSRNALFQAADHLIPAGAQGLLRTLLGKEFMPKWLNKSWFLERGVDIRSMNYVEGKDALRESLVRALTETSVPHLLRYEDRNSMACSVESRVPFLTPKLAEFALSLPESYLLSDDGTSKSVFRQAMRGTVPDDVLDRRDKIGFATPERSWLKEIEPWVDGLLLDREAFRRVPVLDFDEVSSQWTRLKQEPSSFGPKYWRWINLLEWARTFEVEFDA